MTQRTRRGVVLGAWSLVAGAALAACGAPQGSGAGESASKSAAPANLSFATLFKEDPSWNLSKKQLADFEAKFPNVKVQTDWITGSTGDYLKKVQTYLTAGQQPDVLYMHYLQTSIFGNQGVLLDLGKYASGDKAYNAGDFVKGVADHFKYKDKQMGVAWYSGPHTLLFNRTVFQKLGVKTPDEYEKEGKWTWETLRELAQKTTKGAVGSPDRTIGLAPISSINRLGRVERLVWQNGGELFNKEYTKSQFNTPAAVGAMQYVADLYLKDNVVVSADEQRALVASGSAFLSGKVAMEYGIARDAMTAPVDAAQKNNFQLGLVPLPKGKAGRQNIDGPQAYGVGAATKSPDAAWELVKWWADEQRQSERLALGASVPVRTSMQKHKSYTEALRPFESAATLDEAAKTVRAPYSPANLTDIETILDEQWKAILAGQKPVSAAMEDLTKQVDQQLKGV